MMMTGYVMLYTEIFGTNVINYAVKMRKGHFYAQGNTNWWD